MNFTYSNELYHYGVIGMKWGVRRYQNKDGSLTAAGKAKRRNSLEDSGFRQSNYSKKYYTKIFPNGIYSSIGSYKNLTKKDYKKLASISDRLYKNRDQIYKDSKKAILDDIHSDPEYFKNAGLSLKNDNDLDRWLQPTEIDCSPSNYNIRYGFRIPENARKSGRDQYDYIGQCEYIVSCDENAKPKKITFNII